MRKINDEEKLTLWVGATRYYLGRMTYAVGSFCDLLISRWDEIPTDTRRIIQLDIEEAFERDDHFRSIGEEKTYLPLGMDMDRAKWVEVRRLWT
jgi:hypothetical protein